MNIEKGHGGKISLSFPSRYNISLSLRCVDITVGLFPKYVCSPSYWYIHNVSKNSFLTYPIG